MNLSFKNFLRFFLPRTIRPYRILSGPLRSHFILTSWYDYPAAIMGRTERPLLNWFDTNVRSGETWLDIGAHYGYTAIALSRRVGVEGRIFAFEPMLTTAGYLSQTRSFNRLSQLSIMPYALGDVADLSIEQLPIVRGMVDSTISKSKWLESIQVTNLDWLWPRICGVNPQMHGIKIDVQGMEIEALRGMTATLQYWQPKLVVEVHGGVDRAALLDLVKVCGYSQQAVPIEPMEDEVMPRYVDNRSYAFFPNPAY